MVPPAVVVPEVVTAPVEEVAPAAPSPVRVAYHPDDLAGELGGVTELDLAFSASDRLERRASDHDDRDYTQVCADLDLISLAARAPRVRTLRVSGC